jgi:hypothetical protein
MAQGGGHLDPRALAEANTARTVSPWSGDHLVGLLVANGVGMILVFVGWWEASALGRAHDQMAWLNLSVLGLVVAGGANGLWLARGRRMVILARSVVLPYPPGLALLGPGNGRVAAGNGRVASPRVRRPMGRTGPAALGEYAGAEGLVAGRAMSFYHRADCLLVSGKEVTVRRRGDHARAGRRPCEVCRP